MEATAPLQARYESTRNTVQRGKFLRDGTIFDATEKMFDYAEKIFDTTNKISSCADGVFFVSRRGLVNIPGNGGQHRRNPHVQPIRPRAGV